MGSIQKWTKNRYRAHWRDPEGRPQSQVFDFKADARAHLDRVDAAIERGSYISAADRRMTVAQYVNGSWLAAQRWRPTSREQFNSHWHRHLEPRWGNVRLGSIRRTEVQAWVNTIDLAPATVAAIYRRFSSIMRAAEGDGLIDKAPTLKRKSLPARAPASEKLHVPTPGEVQAIAGAMPPRYQPLAWTIAALGLRPSEAVGLTTERLNFLKREVVIDRQLVTLRNAGPVLAVPKTRAGYRTVPVPHQLLDLLAAHLAEFGAVEFEPGAHLVFSGVNDQPIRRSSLTYTWRSAAAQIDLRPELRGWHCLRHYAITKLIAGGVNPDFVRMFAGHESLRETLEVYSGWWPSDADDARQAISEALTATFNAG